MSEREAVDFVGPFERHDVVVGGRVVPYLHAQIHEGGKLTLVLNNRLGLELTLLEAQRVVPFLADCIAVALGYSCHPSADEEPNPNPPFPPLHSIIFPEDQAPEQNR